MVEKICQQCGSKFHTRQKQRVYCDAECARLAYTPEYRTKTRKCIVCEKEFLPWRPGNVYCSKKCKQDNYNLINDIPGQLRAKRELKSD